MKIMRYFLSDKDFLGDPQNLKNEEILIGLSRYE